MFEGVIEHADKLVTWGTLAGTALVWMLLSRMRQEFPSKADLAALSKRHDGAEARLVDLERDVAVIKVQLGQMVTHEDIGEIKASLSGIDATQRAASATMMTIHEQLTILLTKGMAA
jgi:hypothetical protein